MRRGLGFAVLVALLGFGGCEEPASDADTVVLVHGLGRTSRSLLVLETRLRHEGYHVVPFDYPSTTHPIEQLVDSLRSALDGCCSPESNEVHFVPTRWGASSFGACLPATPRTPAASSCSALRTREVRSSMPLRPLHYSALWSVLRG